MKARVMDAYGEREVHGVEERVEEIVEESVRSVKERYVKVWTQLSTKLGFGEKKKKEKGVFGFLQGLEMRIGINGVFDRYDGPIS
ncbi:hypothetical protein NEUTE1DRAFT_141879 [Neurospora tetrasperma FGSC 2508]|uniref:Uncharacterized protein n=1 Tax=Neurospora tetrasperma (strain FGSC 2508 / ATCC MYA-4615 / P0657) TaxID=510951 RepID=F8MYX1_NEUT8|nr:uncharacterized protein NEUTE1DRAFT_141879 [Neurospora tetrasperma FGSC 2508]EGO51969.1 hypothetical protein NEUTE1DRAFT_141879 [Neurospora tetrasperma FGSC 2508]